jgi:hypothetical protein
VHPVRLEDLASERVQSLQSEISRHAFVGLTAAGRREAARRLLLRECTSQQQQHGLIRGDAALRGFLRHVLHTIGTNDLFVALTKTARVLGKCGRDEGLVEWRSAAACARGRFRPDGYGCYRRGPWRFGFFLEYDRGTQQRRQYAAKLAAYYRYRESGAYRRDYQTFPSLLVVATSDLAEARFAFQAYMAQQGHGAPLSVFLTTSGRIEDHPEAMFGPIWRRPGPDAWAPRRPRIRWLPALPRAPSTSRVVFSGC